MNLAVRPAAATQHPRLPPPHGEGSARPSLWGRGESCRAGEGVREAGSRREGTGALPGPLLTHFGGAVSGALIVDRIRWGGKNVSRWPWRTQAGEGAAISRSCCLLGETVQAVPDYSQLRRLRPDTSSPHSR